MNRTLPRPDKDLWNQNISSPLSLTHGVPQGSILGPLLFLVMVADMPTYVTKSVSKAKMTGYADDSQAFAHSKEVNSLKVKLEKVADQMISYCYHWIVT